MAKEDQFGRDVKLANGNVTKGAIASVILIPDNRISGDLVLFIRSRVLLQQLMYFYHSS